jgi:hypothetical protein
MVILTTVSHVEWPYRVTLLLQPRLGVVNSQRWLAVALIATRLHVTSALDVTVALVRHVRPLPTTTTLSCVCAMGMHKP